MPRKGHSEEHVGSEETAQREFEILSSLHRGPAGGFVPAPNRRLKCFERDAVLMEWIEGETLGKILSTRQRILGDDLIRLSDRLFGAVEALHPAIQKIESIRSQPELNALLYEQLQQLQSEEMIHRDLKPSNIMVMNSDDWGIRILDFGVAASVDSARHTRVGTPDYLPPDWGLSKWNVTFDLFAIGRILWRCVSGD